MLLRAFYQNQCKILLRAYKITRKIEPVTCIWMFVCAMKFWAARNGKKWSLGLLMPNLRELGLFHEYFVCKCSFREISMIKIVIFWWKYANIANFENRIIKNSKIRNLYIARLLFMKTEIRQVYNTFQNLILHILCSIIFFVRWILKIVSI